MLFLEAKLKLIGLLTLVLGVLISFFLIEIKTLPQPSQKVEEVMKISEEPTSTMTNPSVTLTPSPTKEKEVVGGKLFVLASIPYWDQERAVASFRKNVDVIDEISLFWYYLKSDGSIAKYRGAAEDTSIINFAKNNKVLTLALFANLPDDGGDWDPERVDRMIGNPASRAKHINEIVSFVERLGFDGANIDYENLKEDQKDNFTTFTKELALELRQRGKRLRVPVFPRTDNVHTHGQDFIELSKAVNELGVMTYNEHYEGSEPGPVASLPWVTANINFAIKLGVPKNVIFLGIPLYGYDWPKSGGAGKGLEFDKVSSLIQKTDSKVNFDQKSASPYFEYNGRIVWFENAASVSEKVKLAKNLNLAGIAFWRLGGEDPKIWQELRKLKF